MAVNSRITITRHPLADTTIGGRASDRTQPDSKHTAALHAFVAALVEHGDHVGEDEHGRVVMQVAVEPSIFDALCLLGADTTDMKPEDAYLVLYSFWSTISRMARWTERHELIATVAYALRQLRPLLRHIVNEKHPDPESLLDPATAAAERIVEHLERSRYEVRERADKPTRAPDAVAVPRYPPFRFSLSLRAIADSASYVARVMRPVMVRR
jgi:hypothetical protein